MALALSTPTLAEAQDRECGNVDAIVRHAYPGAVAQGERSVRAENRTLTLPSPSSINPHAIVCRRWRGQPGLVLVAVPLIAQVSVDSTLGDLDVLVVDEATGRTRQRLRLPTPWTMMLSEYQASRSTPQPIGSRQIDWRSASGANGPEVRAQIHSWKPPCLCSSHAVQPSRRSWTI